MISGLGAGTFTCLAVDANSVVYTNTFVITEPPALTLVVAGETNVACYNGANGAVRVSASGGAAPYSYSWTPASGTSSLLSNLPAGTYTCIVTDANSCSASTSTTLIQPVQLTVFGIASNPTVCSGGTSILIGAGALTYTWTGGATNGVAFTPTATNNYTLTGMDGAGCTATAVTSIFVNSSPTLSIAGSNSVCSGNSLVLTVSGANTYTWDNFSTSSTISVSPLSATNYTVTGMNANGCQNTAIKTVSVINTPTMNANASSPVVCIGNTVSLYGSGATSYTWSGGITNNIAFTPTASSGYTVSASGACGTASSAINITVNALPLVTAHASSTLVCAGSPLTLYGGGASSYTWSNGVINNSAFSPSVSSTYTVIGTDVNGCQNSAVKTIGVNALPVVVANVSSPVICLGFSTTLYGSGASTYTWTSGVTDNTPFSPTTSATYTVTGTDANGCQNTSTKAVSVIIVPVVVANSSNLSVCLGNSLTLSGSGAISYTWSGTVSNNVAFSPSATSTYTLSGSNSCFTASTAITVTVNTLPVITANVINSVVCQGNTTTLYGGGGVTYTWSGGMTNNASFSPPASASYTVIGTGANGCQNLAVTSISVNPLPVVTASASSSVFCFGNSTTLNGGGANTYTWSGNVTDNSPFTPSVTTTYTVTGTGANGCQNTAVKTITVNPLPVVSANAINSVICNGNTVTLNGSGAGTYTWTGNITNGLAFSPSTTITYSVIGTNTLTGCSSTNSGVQTIIVNPSPVISINISNSVVCLGNFVTLSGAGANTYSWTNGIVNAVPFAPGASTTYSLTGTNTLTGCSNSATQQIVVNSLPTVTASVNQNVICYGHTIILTGAGATTYTWTGGASNGVPFSPSITTSYSLSGTNTLTGCTSINNAVQSITVNSLPVVTVNSSHSSICVGGSAILSAGGANTYIWTNGVINGLAFSPTITATYSVSGTNTLTGCTSTNSAIKTITVNNLPPVLASAANPTICVGESSSLTAIGANSYVWSTNETTPSIVHSQSITSAYTVTGTGLNGCSNTSNITQYVSDCTGVKIYEESSANLLSVFPNPSDGDFKIKARSDLNFQIINEVGQVVKSGTLNESNNYALSMNGFSEGIYFIMANKNGQVIKQKIIISN